MKKFLGAVLVVMLSTPAFAAMKCVPDKKGGMCCWDTTTQGPYKPISCY
jgi:hypothetical protein